jgi:hypothetical protein
MENEQEQHLLFSEETPNHHADISPTQKRSHSSRLKTNLVFTLLVLSFGVNVIFFAFSFSRQNRYLSRNREHATH